MSIGARFRQQFERFSPGDPVCVRAPGRVNLIGEHTDYNDGFIISAAIDRFTFVVGKKSENENSGEIRVKSANSQFAGRVTAAIGAADGRVQKPTAAGTEWTHYVLGNV